MSALLHFRWLLSGQKARLTLTLMLALTAIFAGIWLLGVSGWFITAAALAASGAAFNLFVPSSLVRGLSMIRILSRYGERLAGHDATLRMLSALRGWLFATLFPKLPLSFSARQGDLVSRLTADVDALNTAFLSAVIPLLGTFAAGCAMTLAVLLLVPDAAPYYAAVFAVSMFVVPWFLIRSTRRAGQAMVEQASDLRGAVLDGVSGHADLVAFGLTDEALRNFDGAAGRLAASKRAMARRSAAAQALVQVCGATAFVTVLWIGLDAHGRGTIGGPMLAGLLLAIIGSFEAPAMLSRNLARFSASAAAARRLRDIEAAAARIAEPARPTQMPGRFDIAFDGVSFGYGDADVLSDCDLAVAEGEHVAIRGPSGSGKSTILQLLLRLYDPRGGVVRIGGEDLRTLPLADLHRSVALLEQNAPVFLDSVHGNLLIGDPSADDRKLWQALEAAKLADFVRGLPHGLDTVLGETGRTLSAGQARRLCLARTVLSPARIVLLDEPTSGLDRETECAFLRDMERSLAGRTVVLVTHADLPGGSTMRVLALKGGRLEEKQ
ncbi:MAG: thiol reductant ABC exporter subunit CydC [Mesorhizobium sp.]|nr:thiol reductant ABC exporter subunit CydC [Mesorhizobium sp.]MBL8579128.1 thiol reductant ABC exporter subunit CydC [Mesorhizobium sp.]